MGREQAIADLHQALQQGDRVAITAIAGMGGVGKTELAVQYGRQFRDAYPGGVCWLRARESNLEAQVLQKVELELGLSVPQDWRGQRLSLADQVQWCWHNWQPDGLVLVVLDDVTSLADCRAVLPIARRFRVVLTTRQRGLDASFVELSLDVLAKADAVGLLQQIIGAARVERERSDADQLCQWLGYLPLGLELVGRYLATDRLLALGEMRQRLKAQSIQDASVEREAQYQMTAQLGVKAAFELTWQTLDAATAEVAMLLSLFAADGIPWFLVERMMQAVHGEEYAVSAARRALDNRYLIRPVDADAADDSAAYKLHPLIREFLQTKLAAFAAAEPLRQAFVDVLIGIAQQMPQAPTVDAIADFAIVRPHWEEVANGMSDRVGDDDLLWAFLGLVRFYNGQWLYSLAEPWCQACLKTTQERLGEEHPDVATSLNDLAALYSSQGRYSEAEPLFVKGLEMRKRLLGEEHPAVATSLNNLALLYESQGRYSEAEPLYVEGLSILVQKLGDTHPTTRACRQNLDILRQQMRPDRPSPQHRRSHPMIQLLRRMIRALKRLLRR